VEASQLPRGLPFGTCSQRSPARAGPGCSSCAGSSKWESRGCEAAWDLALRIQLVEPVAIDASTGDAMYRLSDRGRRTLRVLTLGRPKDKDE
jgi:hypothetical protein